MEMDLIVNIAIVLVAIISLVWLWKKGYRKQVKEILLVLVIQAEKAWEVVPVRSSSQRYTISYPP